MAAVSSRDQRADRIDILDERRARGAARGGAARSMESEAALRGGGNGVERGLDDRRGRRV